MNINPLLYNSHVYSFPIKVGNFRSVLNCIVSTVPRIGVSTVSYLFKGLFQTPREGYFQIITGILALDQGLAFIGTSAREVPSLAFICTLLSNQESLVCSVAWGKKDYCCSRSLLTKCSTKVSHYIILKSSLNIRFVNTIHLGNK